MSNFEYYPEDDDFHATISTTAPDSDNEAEISILDIADNISSDQMDAMADVLNVLAETGCPPRQLANQVKVLRAALAGMMTYAGIIEERSGDVETGNARAALAATEWSTARPARESA